MAPCLVVKLPLRGTLLQRWPASRQLNTTSQTTTSASASASKAGAIRATPANLDHSFSKDQLAIALTIAKSRPNDITPLEHCQNLMKHIQEGEPKPIEKYKYIDTKGYWKDECIKIHEEKAALENKVLRLEEAQRILMENYRRIEGSEREEHAGPGNRNEMGEDPLEAARSRKRLAMSQDILEDQDVSSELDNDAYLQLSAHTLRIIRQQTHLEKAIHQTSTLVQINHLTKSVIQTISILEKSISDCCLPLRSLKADSDDRQTVDMLRRALHHLACAFHVCFDGMDQLFSSTIFGRIRQQEIVSRMVMFFQSCLDLLKTVSALQSEDEQIRQNQSLRSKRARLEPVEYAVNKYLAQTLASIAAKVDWKVGQTWHSEILEGMLVVVIQHTGRLLRDAVFGEHITEGVLRPETRYVIPILHATLGGANRKGLVNQVLAYGKGSGNLSAINRTPDPSGQCVSGEVLKNLRKKLQSTLLQNTLGGVGLESLKLPPVPPEMSDVEDMRHGVEKYDKAWLVETAVSLIGWDMVTDDLHEVAYAARD